MTSHQKKKTYKESYFVFDAKTFTFLKMYEGVRECAKELEISHNAITLHLDNGKEYKGYLFSSHRLL
jgi:hypothetical protein